MGRAHGGGRAPRPRAPRPSPSVSHPVVLVLARRRLFRRHPPLGQVDVTLVPVDAEHHDGFGAAHFDQFVDRPDAAPRQFGQQNHALRARVLEEGHVRAHLGDVVDLRGGGGFGLRGVGAETRARKRKETTAPLRLSVSPSLSRTMTMTTSSTSGYLASYMRQSPVLAWSAAIAAGAVKGGVASAPLAASRRGTGHTRWRRQRRAAPCGPGAAWPPRAPAADRPAPGRFRNAGVNTRDRARHTCRAGAAAER